MHITRAATTKAIRTGRRICFEMFMASSPVHALGATFRRFSMAITRSRFATRHSRARASGDGLRSSINKDATMRLSLMTLRLEFVIVGAGCDALMYPRVVGPFKVSEH